MLSRRAARRASAGRAARRALGDSYGGLCAIMPAHRGLSRGKIGPAGNRGCPAGAEDKPARPAESGSPGWCGAGRVQGDASPGGEAFPWHAETTSRAPGVRARPVAS